VSFPHCDYFAFKFEIFLLVDLKHSAIIETALSSVFFLGHLSGEPIISGYEETNYLFTSSPLVHSLHKADEMNLMCG